MPTELEVALKAEPAPKKLPVGLPIAHLSVQRWLRSILTVGQLEPRQCHVLREKVLYLSYGGVFFRTSAPSTENATELPVAFVFSPVALSLVSRLFPFDSGAMANGKFGPEWSRRLKPFQSRFSVNTTDALRDAGLLVYHLFETNRQYLKGEACGDGAGKREPIPLLRKFLTDDLSSIQVDHRQRTIEAIAEVDLKLRDSLEWIGVPEIDTLNVQDRLYHWTKPRMVEIHSYGFRKNFHPRELAAQLEQAAYEYVVRKYANFQQ
jgi:hypothetical protein